MSGIVAAYANEEMQMNRDIENRSGGEQGASQKMTQETQSITESTKHRIQESSGKMREGMRQTAEQLKQQTVEAGQKMKEQGKSAAAQQASQQKEKMAGTVSHVGAALREASHKLRDEHDDFIASYADSVAERLESASRYLRQQNFQGMWRDAEGVARKQPEMFMGGMFFAGLALGRFLKASQKNRLESGYGGESDYEVEQFTAETEYAANTETVPGYTPGAMSGGTSIATEASPPTPIPVEVAGTPGSKETWPGGKSPEKY